MSLFYLGLLLVCGMFFLTLGLAAIKLGRRAQKLTVSSEHSSEQQSRENLQWFDRRQQELAKQLEDGEISGEVFRELVEEAKRQLLQATVSDSAQTAATRAGTDKPGVASAWDSRLLLLGVALVPVLAAALYFPFGVSLGSDDQYRIAQQLDQMRDVSGQAQRAVAVEQLLEDLQRYASGPHPDTEILVLLAEVQDGTANYAGAAETYGLLLQREPESPALMTARAEALYMHDLGQGSASSSSTEVERLLDAALALQPEFPRALSLRGIVAFQQQQWQRAIGYWQRARPLYPPGSEQLVTLQRGIQAAQARLGGQAPAAAQHAPASPAAGTPSHAVRLSVSVGEEIKRRAIDPGTPVFIFARPTSGPRMPLAARRLRYADLPVELVLTNEDAMAAMSIAGHSEVEVMARIAFSGQPIAQPGDIQSSALTVAVATLEVNPDTTFEAQAESLATTGLVIDTIVTE